MQKLMEKLMSRVKEGNNYRRDDFPKGKFRMKITVLDKEEDGKLKVVDSKWIKSSGREFMNSIVEDRKNGLTRDIEIVDEAPTSFKVNQIYMLRNREVVWVYMDKGEDNE